MNTCMLHYRNGDPIILGGIGQNGCYFSTKEGTSISGYDRDVSGRLHELAEGAIFVDKRPIADHPEFARWIIRDPIVDVRLPVGATDPIDREEASLMALAVTGAWAHLAEAAAKGSRCLDGESVDRYVARWAARGARIGVRIGDTMKWTQRVAGVDPTAPVYDRIAACAEDEDIPACRCWVGTCLKCRKMRYYVDREPHSGWEVRVRVPSGPDDHCAECRASKEEG